ncbi:MAG: cyclase family protein [Acidimicrobiaceae bacterium]|nr:cyclase family protein [Acidimicrobiaceae bacterium]
MIELSIAISSPQPPTQPMGYYARPNEYQMSISDKHPPLDDYLARNDTLAALALIERGQVYDLDCGRYPGMPVYEGHPPFQVVNYRTSRGIEKQCDHQWWLDPKGTGNNKVSFGWNSEMVLASMHSGTHIDALSHVTKGPNDEWFNGANAEEDLGDFGPLKYDAAEIPPIVLRGVLLDVPGAKDIRALPSHYPITPGDLEATLEAQNTTIAPGMAVLVRTGYLSAWPDAEKENYFQAGINLESAEFLADAGAVLIAGDTEGLENQPSTTPNNPFPVHIELLVDRGVYIVEMVYMEDLARDQQYEFCFICLPLKIKGATGSLVRPIAVA